MLVLKNLLMYGGFGMIVVAVGILGYDLYREVVYRQWLATPGATPVPAAPQWRWRTSIALVLLAWAPILLAFGIVFEIPLVLTFLAQVDLISSRTLIRKRAASHIGMWIASTFLTPGADIYSPIFLGVAMSCLFELTIIFIKIIKK